MINTKEGLLLIGVEMLKAFKGQPCQCGSIILFYVLEETKRKMSIKFKEKTSGLNLTDFIVV